MTKKAVEKVVQDAERAVERAAEVNDDLKERVTELESRVARADKELEEEKAKRCEWLEIVGTAALSIAFLSALAYGCYLVAGFYNTVYETKARIEKLENGIHINCVTDYRTGLTNCTPAWWQR